MIDTTQEKNKRRLSLSEYVELCYHNFQRNWKNYTLPLALVFVLQLFFRLDINYTDSLPDHVFITVKGWKSGLSRGDYVAYKFPTDSPITQFRKGDDMVKIIGGIGGDLVSMTDARAFTVKSPGDSSMTIKLPGVNGTLGVAKTNTLQGKPINAGPVGIIPPGSYYVFAPHKDSLDSRYELVGWISEKDIVGRSFPLF